MYDSHCGTLRFFGCGFGRLWRAWVATRAGTASDSGNLENSRFVSLDAQRCAFDFVVSECEPPAVLFLCGWNCTFLGIALCAGLDRNQMARRNHSARRVAFARWLGLLDSFWRESRQNRRAAAALIKNAGYFCPGRSIRRGLSSSECGVLKLIVRGSVLSFSRNVMFSGLPALRYSSFSFR